MKSACLLRIIPKIALGLVALSFVTVGHSFTYAFSTILKNDGSVIGDTSTGYGGAQVWINDVTQTFHIKAWFTGLEAPSTVAHIHGPTALPNVGNAGVATGVPTFLGFPSGVTSGWYDHTFDPTLASTYNPAFVTAHGGNTASASAAFLAALQDEKAYLNIHSQKYPGGEIRGFFKAPDSGSTLAFLGLALGAIAWTRRHIALVRR